jgi:hypothetical protein
VPVDEHDARHLVRNAERSHEIAYGGAGGQLDEDAAIRSNGWQISGERCEELDLDVQADGRSMVSGGR